MNRVVGLQPHSHYAILVFIVPIPVAAEAWVEATDFPDTLLRISAEVVSAICSCLELNSRNSPPTYCWNGALNICIVIDVFLRDERQMMQTAKFQCTNIQLIPTR